MIPICVQCGTGGNPCRCKVVGPTLGLVAFVAAGVVEWPVGALVYIFKHAKGRRIMGHSATHVYPKVSQNKMLNATKTEKRTYHRHSLQQTQRLEAYFKECPNPEESQRLDLCKELNLEPDQIKFWFQNKRTQNKAQVERNANILLRRENEEIQCENEAMLEALKNVTCPDCGGPPLGVEREHNFQNLHLVNRFLTEKRDNLANNVSMNHYQQTMVDSLASVQGHQIFDTHTSYETLRNNLMNDLSNSSRSSTSQDIQLQLLSQMDMTQLSEIAARAVEELKWLFVTEEALWVMSSIDGTYVIDHESYEKFSHSIKHFRKMSARVESSKEATVVPIEATKLIEMFVDSEEWRRLFPTIVTKATTIHKLGSELSIKQNCINFQVVTWIEHVEVAHKPDAHRLYRDILCGGSGYGAKRWTTTLKRMCERMAVYSTLIVPATDWSEAIATVEGRRSVMKLGERMVRNFNEMLTMSGKVDFPQQSKCGVRISIRMNNEAGQPSGLVASAASSFSVPATPLQVFNILRNNETRHQWDVLCCRTAVSEIARVITGSNENNYITILQPTLREDDGLSMSQGPKKKMVMLQECYMDALGGMIVYAPLDMASMSLAASGEVDPMNIPILSSGFTISNDGRRCMGAEDGGTILTVVFQILVSGEDNRIREVNEQSVDMVSSLISSTVRDIKLLLGCPLG
ncbi:hypothetical protein Bca4012_069340 [Brassica carinata]